MAWYKTGTVALTNASTTITGTSTDFISGARAGDGFLAPDDKLYEIASITSATVLVLAEAYGGSTASGQSYSIVTTQSRVKDLADSATTLVNNFTNAGAGNFGDGTVGSPAISFVNDLDSGWYRIGANNFAGAVGGSKILDLTSTGIDVTGTITVDGLTVDGNVGIGTDSPVYPLVVSNGGAQGLEFIVGTMNYLQSYNRSTSDYAPLRIDAETIAFATDNGSERMRIDSAGNVDVVGDIEVSGGLYLGGTGTANKLDDYEEGTWTPSLNSYSTSFTGTYTKIGNVVHCRVKRWAHIPSSSITGSVIITGLPFSATRTYINNLAHIRGASTGADHRPWGIVDGTSVGLFTDAVFGNTNYYNTDHANWDASKITQNGSTAVIIDWEFSYKV